MPAAENPQGFAFRLSCFLRHWVGGLSRRLLSRSRFFRISQSVGSKVSGSRVKGFLTVGHGAYHPLIDLEAESGTYENNRPLKLKRGGVYLGKDEL